MQTLPPTVAVFQILNDDKNARQHSPINGAAIQSVRCGEGHQPGYFASGGNLEASIADGQRRPAEAVQIDQAAQMRLRLGEQPRAPGQPCVAVAPIERRVAGLWTRNLSNGI